MKTLFYSIAILFVSHVGYAQQAYCKDFHNGDFKVIDSVHNSMTLIERKDSIEIQYIYKHITDTAYDMKLVFKVNWVSECKNEAILVYNFIHTRKGDKHLPTGKKILTNEIVAGDKDSYIVHTQFNDDAHTKFANRVWRMK